MAEIIRPDGAQIDDEPPAAIGHQFTLHWKLWLRVNSQRGADTVLQRFAKALRCELTVGETQRYWKDPAIRVASATTPLDTDDAFRAVFTALRIVNRVTHRMSVTAPEATGDCWIFEGSATQPAIRITGVEAIFFEARNFDFPDEPRTTNRPPPRFQCGERVRMSPAHKGRPELIGVDGVVVGHAPGPLWGYAVRLSHDEQVWSLMDDELEPADLA